MKSVKILTTSREIYTKFNNLNFSDEIILRNVKPFQIERILENANKNGQNIFSSEIYDTHIIVKKLANVNINVNFRT